MEKEFLNIIKKKFMAGAQTSKLKIEEAARTGKLHMKIMGEKRKLSKAYNDLGTEAYLAIQENSYPELIKRKGVEVILNRIKSSMDTINTLEAQLSDEIDE